MGFENFRVSSQKKEENVLDEGVELISEDELRKEESFEMSAKELRERGSRMADYYVAEDIVGEHGLKMNEEGDYWDPETGDVYGPDILEIARKLVSADAGRDLPLGEALFRHQDLKDKKAA